MKYIVHQQVIVRQRFEVEASTLEEAQAQYHAGAVELVTSDVVEDYGVPSFEPAP